MITLLMGSWDVLLCYQMEFLLCILYPFSVNWLAIHTVTEVIKHTPVTSYSRTCHLRLPFCLAKVALNDRWPVIGGSI